MARQQLERRAFLLEERSSAHLTFLVRTVAIMVLAAYVLLQRATGDLAIYYTTFAGILFVSGLFQFKLSLSLGEAPLTALRIAQLFFITLDLLVLAVALVVPSPFAPDAWPAPMQLRVATSSFLFLIVTFAVLGYSPFLTLWSGIAAAMVWMGGALWTLSHPGAITLTRETVAASKIDAVVAVMLDPNYVSLIAAVQESLLFVIAGGVLSVAVWRSRRYARQQVNLSAERSRLSRYFPADMAEALMAREKERQTVERRRAAVLFIDMVGFTSMAEQQDPRTTILALRNFHSRIAKLVFSNGGSVNKYIGDEVMATFGAFTPDPERPGAAERAAADALACAIALADDFTAHPELLEGAPETAIRVGIGVHFGEVVVGDAGGEQFQELAVLGDSVNIAKRLERMTRNFDEPLVASGATVAAALLDDSSDVPRMLRRRLLHGGFHPIKGRQSQIEVYALADAAADGQAGAPETNPDHFVLPQTDYERR
ncbi:MAG: adenylate/guanylate cyclase domain-containing protein [Neomegalonema sp.]|nr:adenylate/guanylate cyclase domain-containing protein [Neomegalonema sp.]